VELAAMKVTLDLAPELLLVDIVVAVVLVVVDSVDDANASHANTEIEPCSQFVQPN
jgi:hypothetical protein